MGLLFHMFISYISLFSKINTLQFPDKIQEYIFSSVVVTAKLDGKCLSFKEKLVSLLTPNNL